MLALQEVFCSSRAGIFHICTKRRFSFLVSGSDLTWDLFPRALACCRQKEHRDETFPCGYVARHMKDFPHFFLKMDLSVENDWSRWTYGQLELGKLNVTAGW